MKRVWIVVNGYGTPLRYELTRTRKKFVTFFTSYGAARNAFRRSLTIYKQNGEHVDDSYPKRIVRAEINKYD